MLTIKTIKLNSGFMSKHHDKIETFKDKYVDWKATYDRGLHYWDIPYQPFKIFVMLLAIQYFAWLPNWILWCLVPFWFIFWFCLGYVDRHYVKLWQRQAEWSARKINPFEQELMKRIKNIERSLKCTQNKKRR